ncbi:MAG: MFS transporter [Planctomycetes bacterium]|nr:MFS transporter [Planctomycetota bacterium]
MASETTRLVPDQASTPELAAYYADRSILRRNIIVLMACNASWQLVSTVVAPLMTLHMSDCGISNGTLGLINSINLWVVSVLVMYFSWRSDHTVSRFGRRVPYFLVSAVFLIAVQALFPWFDSPITLITLYAVLLLFGDLKNSTYVLLPIDCFPRARLAQLASIYSIVSGLVGFAALRWGFHAVEGAEWMAYVGGAAFMFATSFLVFLIREPPVHNPTSESWKPWSALAIGWRDRRTIVLMLGVGMIHSFIIMYNTWVWLFAKKDLGLEKTMIGEALAWSPLIGVALAWPLGWVIDRFGGLRVVVAFWALQAVTCWFAMRIHDQSSLILASVCATIAMPLYTAADLLVFKTAAPAEVGSVTSSNSFTRNLYAGMLMVVSGYLIDALGGDYQAAFALGLAMSTVGLGLLLLHRRLMRRSQPAAATTSIGA